MTNQPALFPIPTRGTRLLFHCASRLIAIGVVSTICYLLAFFFRYRFLIPTEVFSWMQATLPAVIFVKLFVTGLLGIWRPSFWDSPHPLPTLVFGIGLAAAGLFLANFFLFPIYFHAIPRTVIAVDGVLSALSGWLWSRGNRSSEKTNWASWGLTVTAVGLGLAIPIRLGWELSQVGENSHSHDYSDYVQTCDQLLSGEVHWVKLPLETMVVGGSHCMMFPTLVRLSLISITDWSTHHELAITIVFALLKTLVLALLFGRGLSTPAKALVFTLLSALIFSLSHLDSFQFGPAGLNQQLADLFFVLGIACVVFRPTGWTLAMIVCGIGASWSYGSGIMSWPTFLIGLCFLRPHRWFVYLAWFSGAFVSAIPYLWYRLGNFPARSFDGNFFPWELWFQSLSLPFYRKLELHQAPWKWQTIGTTGVVLLLLLGLLAYREHWNNNRSRLAPPTLVGLYSLATIWLITCGQNGLQPWYSVHFAMFWVSLVGFSFLLGLSNVKWPMIGVGLRYLLICGLLVVWIPGNRTTEGNSSFLVGASPVAMTALREYRTAPMEYAQFTFYKGNHKKFFQHAARLEKHGWSVFGKKRTYLLQGEFGLDNVQLVEYPGTESTGWVNKRTKEKITFKNHRRLNLSIQPPNFLKWEIAIPAEVSTATFQSALASSQEDERPTQGTGRVQIKTVTGQTVFDWSSNLATQRAGWSEFQFDLAAFAGQTVHILFRAEAKSPLNKVTTLWQVPRVEMKLTSRPDFHPPEPPSNKLTHPPRLSAQDVVMDRDEWVTPPEFVKRSGDLPERWTIQTGRSWFDSRQPLGLACRDYSHISVECALFPPTPDSLEIWKTQSLYLLDSNPRDYITIVIVGKQGGENRRHEIYLPLLNDGKNHRYAVDLRKQEIDPDTIISKVTIAPSGASVGLTRDFYLGEVRFIRRSESQ